jgi:Arc/MetJ family transcription regulator
MPAHFKKKTAAVILPSAVEKKAGEVADAFFAQTQKEIVITDGLRTAADQAERVLVKIQLHDLSIFLNQKAAQEIKQAHDIAVAAGKSKTQVLAAMTAVIESQIARKVFISKHLSGRAFDVRSKDMTPKQQTVFKQVVQHVGDVSMILEGKPPHFHLQLA